MGGTAPFRRFLAGAVAVLSLTVLGGAGVYAFSETVAPVYPDAHVRAAAFAEVAGEVTALSIGNSHNRAIDFEALGVAGFHLWWHGGDLLEAARALEKAAPQTPGLRHVLVSIPPFAHDNGAIGEADPARGGLRQKAYVEYGDYRPISGDWKLALRAALAPVARPDSWHAVLATLVRGARQDSISRDGVPIRRARGARRDLATDTTLAVERSDDHIEQEAVSLRRRPGLCREVAAALDAIVQTSRAAGARVVFYTPPFMPVYTERMARRGDVCQLGALAARAAARNDHVEYVDQRSGSELSWSPALLHNTDHLNPEGAKVFSQYLRRVAIR